MPRKWEIAGPVIKEYLDKNGDQYVNELSEVLNISPYVIRTAADKFGFSERIYLGMSPKQKEARDKKLSEAVKNQVKSGDFHKSHKYDEAWKKNVKQGIEKFKENPERVLESQKARDNTCKQKYGQDYRHAFQEAAKKTKQLRYGYSGYNNSIKAKQTKLEKYGDPNYNNREKAIETCNHRYGGYGNASPILINKYKRTCLERYGVETNLLSKNDDLNGHNSILARFGSDEARYKYTLQKGKETRKKKYGDPYWSNKGKAQETIRQKYSVNSYLETREARLAKDNKYQRNFYNMLVEIFDTSYILKEYKSEKYPWFCDFYIKSKNLYVEYNFHWTHGPHPFDSTSKQDIELFNIYAARLKAGKSSYAQVIHTWCIDDRNKLKSALKNKLNYVTVYGNSFERMTVYAYIRGIYSKSEGSSFKAKLNISRALA